MPRKLKFEEACQEVGVEGPVLVRYVHEHWIVPVEGESLDEEDLARVRLIAELQRELGVNDEAIPIILHLLDQLHALRRLARRAA